MAKDRFDHVFIQPTSFDASLAFYREGLGWQVSFSWGGEGEPRGVALSSGAMSIVLAEAHPSGDQSKTRGINGTRPSIHLSVEDVGERYVEVQAAGLTPSLPEITHWGSRWFVVADPDGNVVAFEQHQGHAS